MNTRLWIVYIAVFALGLMSFVLMIRSNPNPETLILGEWQELKWEYEKADKSMDIAKYSMESRDVKNSMGQNLVIHQAETWRFLPNRRLILTGEDWEQVARWRIKGRGHILQLVYENNNLTENYNITELSEKTMVLNFDSDIQARGVAKLTFQKKD